MRATVVLARHRGIRRGRHEIASDGGYIGDLEVADWNDPKVFGRVVRVATLRFKGARPSEEQEVLPPLVDPVVVRISGDRIVLTGIELAGSPGDSRTPGYAQGWIVQPLDYMRDIDGIAVARR